MQIAKKIFAHYVTVVHIKVITDPFSCIFHQEDLTHSGLGLPFGYKDLAHRPDGVSLTFNEISKIALEICAP